MSKKQHAFDAMMIWPDGSEVRLVRFMVTNRRKADKAYEMAERICEQARRDGNAAFVREELPDE